MPKKYSPLDVYAYKDKGLPPMRVWAHYTNT